MLCNLKTLTTALIYGWLVSMRRVRQNWLALALLLLAGGLLRCQLIFSAKLPLLSGSGVVDSVSGLQRPRDEAWLARETFLTKRGLGAVLTDSKKYHSSSPLRPQS